MLGRPEGRNLSSPAARLTQTNKRSNLAGRMDEPSGDQRDVSQTLEEVRRGAAMSETSLTITLGGNVPLDLFAETMQRFRRLIDLLSVEVSRDADITWIVDELSAGSTIVAIRGEAEQPEAVERVGRAYNVVGHALEKRQVIPYSPQIAQVAESITQVLNGQITSIQFEALSVVATVTSGVPVEQVVGLLGAWGSVEGRVETLTSRRRLGFTLYDSLNDKAVNCHLTDEQADLARPAWGRRVIVQGWVRRDQTSGRPVSIDPVRSIEVLPEVEPGSYRRARGVAPARPGQPMPEVTIRRLRDA